MKISFFNTPSGGTATPRYKHHCNTLTSLDHEVSEENLDADILVLWSPISVDILSLALKIKKMRKILIYECYYSLVESFLDEGVIEAKSRRESRLRFMEKSMFELADLILVDTVANQNYFSKLYSVSKKKIVPIYGLVDTMVFKEDSSLERDLKLSHPIFFYHGSFLKVHGVDTIISAFQQVVAEEKNSSLLLIGSITSTMENKIQKRLKTVPNAILAPPVAHDVVPSYLNSIDIWLGAFGSSPKSNRTARFAMLEAMATKRIVITANTDENKNIIKDGVNGYLVAPSNPEELAQKMIFTIREKNEHIGINARKLVLQRYHLDSLKKIFEEQIIPIDFHPKFLFLIRLRLFVLKTGLSIKKKIRKSKQ